jgi:hypothetical protein
VTDEIGWFAGGLAGDEEILGGFERGGEAGAVWVDAGAGFDGGDHGAAQCLVDGQ